MTLFRTKHNTLGALQGFAGTLVYILLTRRTKQIEMKRRCSPRSSKRWWLGAQVANEVWRGRLAGPRLLLGAPFSVTVAAKCMLDAAFRLLSQKQKVSGLLSLALSGADQVILKATSAYRRRWKRKEYLYTLMCRQLQAS